MAQQNDWFWYELLTSDPDAAAKFYSNVVGWKVTQYPAPEGAPRYLIGEAGDRGVVGLMGFPPEMPAGVPPHWTGYLYTENADATAKTVKENGGHVHREPQDIPGVGRFAVLSDPEGGKFNVMTPDSNENPPQLAPNTPGNVSWCELSSDDAGKNFAWYQKLFGWKSVNVMDMGELGKYEIFSSSDQPMTGGSAGKMGRTMPTGWLFYFFVDGGIDAAIERANKGGGNIFMGPHEVPGGTWVAIGNDPQGGVFALHSQTK